jgi:uracil-DNA glycosylase
VGFVPPAHGFLEHWAQQGVLMLNTCLTVRAHEANSHKDHGWQTFTDAVIKCINEKKENVRILFNCFFVKMSI